MKSHQAEAPALTAGSPEQSPSWKRTQVLIVCIFWLWQIRRKGGNGPRGLKWLGKPLHQFTPWQLCCGTLVGAYVVRNMTYLLGLAAPDPLARLYSPDFYRATWINTAIDAGFATAMPMRPKFVRDLAGVCFSAYYLWFAQAADEKVRKFRALSTVEFLRATWEKQTNPIIWAFTFFLRPKLPVRQHVILPRPHGSPYNKPVGAWLYFAGKPSELSKCKELLLDFPGGGFVSMSPLNHEERLIRWAKRTRRPILSIDYCKAPEAPYPYAIHEGLDVYRLLCHTRGSCIGMQGSSDLRIVISGDSAGANIGAAVVIKVLEMPEQIRLPLPAAMVWAYPALNFNFESWMSPRDLAVLQQEPHGHLQGFKQQKDHLSHRSPLSIVDDKPPTRRRTKSWSKSFSRLPFVGSTSMPSTPLPTALNPFATVQSAPALHSEPPSDDEDSSGTETGAEEHEKSLARRVRYWNAEEDAGAAEVRPTSAQVGPKAVVPVQESRKMQTRLTMTSRTACFNDRVLSAPMMRSMAICYLSTNYLISPILAPDELLARFPKCFLICGEKDPLSDDSIIFAGRLKEAKATRKRQLQEQLETTDEPSLLALDPLLRQDDFDWVEVSFIEGWSHGFLQMSALIPRVSTLLDEMADWIMEGFSGAPSRSRMTSRNHSRTSTVTLKPMRSPSIALDSDVLSFSTRRRPTAQGTSNGTPTEKQLAEVKATSDLKLASAALEHLHQASSSDPSTPRRPDLAEARSASDNLPKERRSSSNTRVPFDAGPLLQRRRDEAVFGLQSEGSPGSPTQENLKHDDAGAARAEDLEGYSM